MRPVDYIFALFLITSCLDPTSYFCNAKFVLFIILVAYGIICCFSNKVNISKINYVTVVAFMLLPLIGISVAILLDNLSDTDYAFSHVKSMSFILLFFYLRTVKIEALLKILWFNGILLSITTVVLFFLCHFSEVYGMVIYELGLDSGSFMTAHNRSFLGVTINGLYFRAGPLIIFSFVYHLYNYKGILRIPISILLLFALLCSGSRTPALIQILVLLLFLYDKRVLGKVLTRMSAIIVAVLFVGFVIALATEKDVDSNDLKYSNFDSYVADIETGSHSITGAGVGSTFYAKGDKEMLAFTELSYMDIIRMYGIPVGAYMLYLFFAPFLLTLGKFKNNIFMKRLMLSYAMFLVLAGTNPLLMGSVGMTSLSVFMALTNSLKEFSKVYDVKSLELKTV